MVVYLDRVIPVEGRARERESPRASGEVREAETA